MSETRETTENSKAARLDPATEERIYRLYREYFQAAEENRNGNLWEVIAWDAALTEPPAALTDAALEMYRDGILLPDFSARMLQTLRSSRGRAWFVTRWSYEEVKAHLTVREWLLRAGIADETLKTLSDDLMASFRWEPEIDEPLPVMADALLWELRQIEKTRDLRDAAKSAGDPALTDAATRLLTDHEAHRDFLRASLRIIADTYPDDVRTSVKTIAPFSEDPSAERTLLALLDIPN